MKFEDIEIGKMYHINYVDVNYPCNCPCHTNKNVMHIEEYCFDRSYKGPALCVSKCDAINSNRIHFQSPVDKLLHFAIFAEDVSETE